MVEASLGYFVTPLVNVLLGTWVLKERPRRLQWLAVAVAACGVLWLTLTLGRPPWIALGLAGSFGSYGLLRKTAPLGALEGLAVETAVIAPVALVALAWMSAPHGGLPGLFAGMDGATVGWLLFAGPLTAIPLLLFAAGARRITLATLGTLQYLSPTIQFLLGVTFFGEPLEAVRLVGFVLIWTALAVYSADGFLWLRRQRGGRGRRPLGSATASGRIDLQRAVVVPDGPQQRVQRERRAADRGGQVAVLRDTRIAGGATPASTAEARQALHGGVEEMTRRRA